jgi:hypothetical protein
MIQSITQDSLLSILTHLETSLVLAQLTFVSYLYQLFLKARLSRTLATSLIIEVS